MKTIIVVIVLIVLMVSLTIICVKNEKLTRCYNKQVEKYNKIKVTLEIIQQESIQRLLSHVKEVMTGKIILDDENNPLSRYSYKMDTYPKMHTVETNIEVIDAHLENNVGEIAVCYYMRYLDSTGKVLMYGSATFDFPAIWSIEKQGEEWIVVDIDEHP